MKRTWKTLACYSIFFLLTTGPAVFGLPQISVEGPNLVQNASFEETDSDRPVAWSGDSAVCSLANDVACDGSKSLHYKNDDPKRYVLCSQQVPVEAQSRYEFRSRVRIQSLDGESATANICMEWSDESGKWLGGSYASNPSQPDANGWCDLVGYSRSIPDDAARVTFSLYLSRGSTGEVWFDQVSVREFRSTRIITATTDCYRQLSTGGPVRVAALFNPENHVISTDGLTLTVTGNSLATPLVLTSDSCDSSCAFFSMDTTDWVPGNYELELRDDQTPSFAPITMTLKRVESLPDRKAWFDSHRRLILDGQPFFPIGLYMGGVSDEDLATIAGSPFNCLMPYAMIDRDQLDKANEKNLKIIYSIKDVYAGHFDLKSDEEARERIRSIVEPLKDHPAIIAWYLNDEFPLDRLPELVSHRDLIEELDPGRPGWTVLYQVDDIPYYVNTFDVIGSDPYPIPSGASQMAWLWSRKTNQGTGFFKPVWQVPQLFNWAVYRDNANQKKNDRAPTLEEMRGMIWMNIAGGANGVICYSFFDLKKMDKEPGDAYGLPNERKPFDQSWTEVQSIAREVADARDILLAVDDPMPLTESQPTESDIPKVGFRLYGRDGVTWILAVNLTGEPVTWSMKAEQELTLEKIQVGRDESITLDGSSVSISFQPLEPVLVGVRVK